MRYLRPSLAIPAILLVLLLVTGCSGPELGSAADVWLVQATDPHVFEKVPKPDAPDRDEQDRARKTQEQGNREAFLTLLEMLHSLPGSGAKADYLVITGDFGFGESEEQATQSVSAAAPAMPDPPEEETTGASIPSAGTLSPPAQAPPCAATGNREGRINCLAHLLKTSSLRDVYLVPGNNDVEEENADTGSLRNYHSFLDEVEARAGSIAIHDLTRCYMAGEPLSRCWADVPGTSFRLVGFPSHSFKAKKPEQPGQMQTLSKLLERAQTDGKRVLLLTHIAELDDPYLRAMKELTGEQPTGRIAGFELSSWEVTSEVYQEWNRLVRMDTVDRVLAGHFHDFHREFYRSPRGWSREASNRAPLEKLLLAPPLSIKRQEDKPVQARGFSLLRLEGDSLSRRLYWYDSARKRFEPEMVPERLQPPRPLAWTAVLRWFWGLATKPLDLSRAAIIAIAFLAAFLTIVELWEVPPPSSPLARAGAANAAVNPPPPAGGGIGNFKSNFAKTVLAGFGGILILDFLDSFWKMPELNAKTYYIVLFVTFFFLMLIVYAFLQALTEALRSRILTRQPVRPWRAWAPRQRRGPNGNPPRNPNGGPPGDPGGGNPVGGPNGDPPGSSLEDPHRRPGWSAVPAFRNWLSYSTGRIWHWALSLRAFLLVFADTLSSVLLGRNQLKTVVFEKEIVSLHLGIVRAADRIREEVERAVLQALKEKEARDEDVRVSISVLSEDESVLFYIARERGSLARSFDQRSVAWVSVYTGVALWWEQGYPPESVLLNNASGGFQLLPAQEIRLGEYYQQRPGSDYQAFLVLPVPWAYRGASEVVRKAGIQISFRLAEHMEAVVEHLEKDGKPTYTAWSSLLEEVPEGSLRVRDPQLRNVLRHSLGILEELFVPFNETVFDLYIRPQIRGQ